MFNTWISFFNNEMSEVVSFFSGIFSMFPSRLVAILMFFPALSMVFGLVSYCTSIIRGGK